MNTKIINPILPGFFPDPSICEANGAYYLVNSSFSYFPGLPIFKSTDCCNWEQIGNIIHRESQLDFIGQGVSRGLFAPTIRYHNGRFYCICTQVDRIGNFFVYADNPEGPWSDPIVIPGAEGIDPSLFFDDDGKVWYTGTRPAPEGVKWNGNWEIWIQQLDIETGKLLGEPKGIWRGALKQCIWPEGPHIYKIDGTYFLMHAEGGTGPDHAVCIAKCDTIDGEWVGKPANPILTHRHLGMGAGVVYVGHADLFKDTNGRWWMVCLASRPYGKVGEKCCNMGRETFLVPVKWENGWPLVSWQTGLVENAYTIEGNVAKRENSDTDAVIFPEKDDFDCDKLADYWISLRSRNPKLVTLSENKGNLRLYASGNICGTEETSFVAQRQTAFSYESYTKMNANLKSNGDGAGLCCFQCENFNYKLQLTLKDGKYFVQLLKNDGSEKLDSVIAEKQVDSNQIVLGVVANKQKLQFVFGADKSNLQVLASDIDATILSVEKAGGFVGTIIGMYAQSENGNESYADFDWFEYKNLTKEWIDNE